MDKHDIVWISSFHQFQHKPCSFRFLEHFICAIHLCQYYYYYFIVSKLFQLSGKNIYVPPVHWVSRVCGWVHLYVGTLRKQVMPEGSRLKCLFMVVRWVARSHSCSPTSIYKLPTTWGNYSDRFACMVDNNSKYVLLTSVRVFPKSIFWLCSVLHINSIFQSKNNSL